MPRDQGIKSTDRARTAAIRRFAVSDAVFYRLTQGAALVVLLILGGVIVSLVDGSLPAFQKFGLGFLTTEVWNPVTEKFGALAAIYRNGRNIDHRHGDRRAGRARHRGFSDRTLPASRCAGRSASPSNCSAGIPSIIYGIWGLFVFAPFLQAYVQPYRDRALRRRPGALVAFRRAALRYRHPDGGR